MPPKTYSLPSALHAAAAVHDVLAERMGGVTRHNDALQANEKAASAELETKLRGAAVALAREQFGAISGTRDSDLYTARLPGAPTTNYGFGSAAKRLVSASDKSIGIGRGFQNRITASGAARRPPAGYGSVAGRLKGGGSGNPLRAPYQYAGEHHASTTHAAAYARQ